MSDLTLKDLENELKNKADSSKATILQKFFKTGPGEYGEGDIFLGVVVPELRKCAKRYRHLNLSDLQQLIYSPEHEKRQIALFILVLQYKDKNATDKQRIGIYQFFIKHLQQINNWDLIDLNVEHVLGHHLYNKDKSLLYKWAKSKKMWERRIAILTTFHYIKKNQFNETLKIAEMLIADQEDLIHKAVGWMLREVGKRNLELEETFLLNHYKEMPRTMLRYAIEKFPEKKRQAYLKGLL